MNITFVVPLKLCDHCLDIISRNMLPLRDNILWIFFFVVNFWSLYSTFRSFRFRKILQLTRSSGTDWNWAEFHQLCESFFFQFKKNTLYVYWILLNSLVVSWSLFTFDSWLALYFSLFSISIDNQVHFSWFTCPSERFLSRALCWTNMLKAFFFSFLRVHLQKKIIGE